MADNPRSDIQELLKSFKDTNIKPTYDELYMELSRINREDYNTFGNASHDSSWKDAVAANREDKKLSGISKTQQKDTFYGIVLYKDIKDANVVYIDVPGVNLKKIKILDPDVFYKKDVDLQVFAEYAHSIAPGIENSATPVVGGIAEVKQQGQRINIYNGMVSGKDVVVLIDTSGKKIQNKPGNGVNAQNSGETSPSTSQGLNGKERIDTKKNRQSVVGYFYKKPVNIEVEQIGPLARAKIYCEINAAASYRKLMTAYNTYIDSLEQSLIKSTSSKNKSICKPYVTSGFRDNGLQTDLYTAYEKRGFNPPQVAQPGKSNHQAGLALDIIGTQEEVSNGVKGAARGVRLEGSGLFYEWMKKNAPVYGFKRTVLSEPWHWEFRNQWVGSRENDYWGNALESNQPIASQAAA